MSNSLSLPRVSQASRCRVCNAVSAQNPVPDFSAMIRLDRHGGRRNAGSRVPSPGRPSACRQHGRQPGPAPTFPTPDLTIPI